MEVTWNPSVECPVRSNGGIDTFVIVPKDALDGNVSIGAKAMEKLDAQSRETCPSKCQWSAEGRGGAAE